MITKLKYYSWTYQNRRLYLTRKDSGSQMVLNKVEFLSLARFILRALDRMRVEENVKLRNELVDLKEKYRASIKEKKAVQKALSKQLKKESRHTVGEPSKNSSGE